MVALHSLGTTLDKLKAASPSYQPLFSLNHSDYASSHAFLDEIITSARAEALKQSIPITLQRTVATIPLEGVDVPFHSSYLRGGVQPFRAMLLDKIKEDYLDPNKLIGKYIPNLTAKPFEISKEYFEETYALTQSPRLKDVLDNVRPSYTYELSVLVNALLMPCSEIVGSDMCRHLMDFYRRIGWGVQLDMNIAQCI